MIIIIIIKKNSKIKDKIEKFPHRIKKNKWVLKQTL